MYLSMEQLIGAIRQKTHVKSYNTNPGQMITSFELLPAAANDALDPETVYLCDYRKLRHCDPYWSPAPLICAVGVGVEPDEVFFAHRCVIVARDSSVAQVLLYLSNAMYDFGQESSYLTELSTLLLKCTSAQDLVDVGTDSLGNPIIVTDQSQKVILHSQFNQEPNPLFEEVVRLDYLPVGHVGGTDYPYRAKLFWDSGSDDLPDVICKTMNVGSTFVGWLHIFQFNRDFTAQDIHVADLLGNMLAIELWRKSDHRGVNQEEQNAQLLRDILDETVVSRPDTEAHLADIAWHPQPFLRAIIVRAAAKEVMPRVSYQLLRRQLVNQLPGCTALIYQNSIFLLLESHREITEVEAFLQPWKATLEEYHLVAGISNSFSALWQLREFGLQALKALQLGSELHPNQLFYAYCDYSVYYMIELSLKGTHMEDFCMPGLVRLAEDSGQNNDHLMETLKVFLRCGRSKAETARELDIHVNTVRYRVEQIEKILGINLENEDHTLDLLLSLKLMEFCSVTQTKPNSLPPSTESSPRITESAVGV